MLSVDDVASLACPDCHGPLTFRGESHDTRLVTGALPCARCGASWAVREGVARLYREARVAGNDRLLRHIYDALPSLHDPAVKVLLPLFGAGTEHALREAYIRRVALGALARRPDGSPPRVLVVGIGAGADLPYVRRHAPRDVPVEVWGVDLSLGMLGVCAKRLRRERDATTRLLACDAHALPFPDGAFERVFQAGAINNYRDPARALREMARVARPGTPIVVVDEQLDPRARNNLYHRAAFRLVTFYDPAPHCPREHLPPDAVDVVEEQVGRFFYCLTFRVGAGAAASA